MSVDAQTPTSPTPIPPALGEFDLLHETASHPLLADLLQRAMGADYPVDVDPSSSCTQSLLAHKREVRHHYAPKRQRHYRHLTSVGCT